MTPPCPPLPLALNAEPLSLDTPGTGRIQIYRAGPGGGPPLVLVHSVNAAASAFEMRPIFERYRLDRPVYALDLPGFGCSERSARRYTPRGMTDAILALVREARRREGGGPVDALGLSLSCEFLARAAAEEAGAFRSVALVSPTGLEGRLRLGPAGTTREVPGMHALLACPLWSEALYRNLTRPGVIRYFLERTWGGPRIDEELWAYDVKTARAPGARYAPLDFLSAALFSADIGRVYQALTQPVWLSHGVRGDFVRFKGAHLLANRDRWTTTVFDTGAMPYFEEPEPFFAAYDAFLARA